MADDEPELDTCTPAGALAWVDRRLASVRTIVGVVVGVGVCVVPLVVVLKYLRRARVWPSLGEVAVLSAIVVGVCLLLTAVYVFVAGDHRLFRARSVLRSAERQPIEIGSVARTRRSVGGVEFQRTEVVVKMAAGPISAWAETVEGLRPPDVQEGQRASAWLGGSTVVVGAGGAVFVGDASSTGASG